MNIIQIKKRKTHISTSEQIIKVRAYQTADGQIFEKKSLAMKHERACQRDQELKNCYKFIHLDLGEYYYIVVYRPSIHDESFFSDMKEYFGDVDREGEFQKGYNLTRRNDGGDYRDTLYVTSFSDEISKREKEINQLRDIMESNNG